MAKYPETASFAGVLRPMRTEYDIKDMEVEGEIPAQLDGMFHRVNPDPQFPPIDENDQFFNGDGMASLFRFKDGKVDFRHRWIRTDKWELENEAGKALFGAYRNPLTDDQSVKGKIRGTANTNVMVHAGQLYAMKEDSPCFLMDPLTLESKGYTDFGGKLKSQTFTAHPKLDPVSGNFCGFGYATKGLLTRDMSYFEIDPAGNLVREIEFENPYYCMMHDFGVTEHYALFHVVPIVSSWERLEAGLPHFGFDTTLPVYLGVLPRDGEASDIRWFRAPKTVFASHVMNAFEDGKKIHFDIPVAENNSFPFFPDIHGAPFDSVAALPYLTRWTVDLSSNSDEFASVERLTDKADEFPRIDDRYATNAYRHGWMLVFDTDRPYNGPGAPFQAVPNTLGHIDLATGRTKTWWPGADYGIQEPCFVPRRPDAPEGDGYLIALVDNHVVNTSELVVLDAQHLDEGPIGRARLPFRMRQGLHGNWADSTRLAA